MDGIGGYTSTWKVIPIDPHTWQGTETLTGVKKIKVINKATDSVPKIQSGSMSVVLPAGERFTNGWYRLVMIATDSSGSSQRFEVATLLFEQSKGENNYDAETITINGQSVLKPVEDRHMRYGSYIAKNENGAYWCQNILNECTPAPVILDDPEGFTVDRYYVFDGATSCLKAVWKMLDAAEWILQIHGDGSIHILKKPKISKMEIGGENARYIKPGIQYEEDISSVPNVYYARLNGQTAEARNEDPNSITSIQRRTYIKDVTELNPVPINGESLDHYVNRKLEEASTIYKSYSYSRDFDFDVRVFDNVRWNIPDVHTGPMRILEQTVVCEQGVLFEEKCGEEIKLWQMIH